MKLVALLAFATAAVGAAVQEMPAPEAQGEHRWLEQLVGEWSVTSEATMAPGAEPMRWEASESVRSLGGLWTVGELSSRDGGMSFTAVLTLGYDPAEKAFVGTWISTMDTHLWTYRGQLDPARKVLTLEAEGPAFDDPSETAKYRDALEILGPDHKVLTSSVQLEDGTWQAFMRADYRRKP